MKKDFIPTIILVIFGLSLVFIFFACGPKQTRHLGTWEAMMPGEGEVVWQFDKTSLQIRFGEKFENRTYNCSYKINYSKKPIELDIQMAGQNIRCILEFSGKDSFMVTGEDNDTKPRPRLFEGAKDVFTFNRIKE